MDSTTAKIFQPLNQYKVLLVFLTLALSTSLFSQESKIYNLSDKAYGLTWDGTYFYYLDSERRALIRFNEIGGQEIFNLGLANMKGITFDSREGRLLVTAPRVILKIDPNTGGVVDRVPVSITQLGGIASEGGLYYLLDIESGKVQFFDKASSMVVGGFLTDRASPRDLAFEKNSIWVSDSSNSTIYRYNPNSGKITGSIQAPAEDIRGLVFSNAKLWVVDRGSKLIKDIPFIETDKFLSSGESDYQVSYKLSYTLPDISLAKSELGILMPPTNEQQRIRNFETKEKGFRNGVIGKDRGLVKKLGIDQARGNQSTVFEFQVKVSNTVYYVDDRFLKKKESIPQELEKFYNPKTEKTQLSPADVLNLLNQTLSREKNFKKLYSRLQEEGFPTRFSKSFIFRKESASDKTDIQESEYLNIYLPGFGWIPFSMQSSTPTKDNRTFEMRENEIVIYQSDSIPNLSSPIFFRGSPNDEWKNLESRIEVNIKKK